MGGAGPGVLPDVDRAGPRGRCVSDARARNGDDRRGHDGATGRTAGVGGAGAEVGRPGLGSRARARAPRPSRVR